MTRFALFLLFILASHIIARDLFAMEQQTVDMYADYVNKYGWPAIAIIGSPVLSWRLIQWIKLTAKRINGHKPNATVLDISGFSIVFVITFFAWNIQAENALFVAFIVSMLHTGIVKAVFKYAPKPIVEVLAYGAQDDQTKFVTLLAGKDRRSAKKIPSDEWTNDQRTRVMTDDEKREITKPK